MGARNSTTFTSERVAEMNRQRAVSFDETYIPEPNSGCWLWIGALNTHGYGICNSAGNERLAHRRSWVRKNGPIPEGMWVLHKCDNPVCINPDHLFVGTRQDNVDDMVAKGRGAKLSGDKNPNARLSVAQVEAIRSDPRPTRYIVAEYEICPAHVRRIRTGTSWPQQTQGGKP